MTQRRQQQRQQQQTEALPRPPAFCDAFFGVLLLLLASRCTAEAALELRYTGCLVQAVDHGTADPEQLCAQGGLVG